MFQLEQLYSEVLYETLHTIGSEASKNRDAILMFLQNAFQFNDEKHEALLEEARAKEVKATTQENSTLPNTFYILSYFYLKFSLLNLFNITYLQNSVSGTFQKSIISVRTRYKIETFCVRTLDWVRALWRP